MIHIIVSVESVCEMTTDMMVRMRMVLISVKGSFPQRGKDGTEVMTY